MSDHSEPRTEAPYEGDELRRAPSLVLVNTGHGKGKSTAAFGTLMRAVARGWDSAVVQFLKSGKWHTGEEEVSRGLGVDWIDADDVAAAVANRPEHVNVILTGRDMADQVVDVADTMTEMVKVEHPFDRKIRAKRGIDY